MRQNSSVQMPSTHFSLDDPQLLIQFFANLRALYQRVKRDEERSLKLDYHQAELKLE
jgi:hypothetical protein